MNKIAANSKPVTSFLKMSLARGSQIGGAAALAIITNLALADPLLTYPLKIKGHQIRAEVANTDDARRQGLMFRKQLGENNGMLFIYERPGVQAMWMKNTLIPLSVAFIDKAGRILNIEDMAPQTEDPHASEGEAWYSLEMNQGWFQKRGLKKGDRFEGLEAIPKAPK